MKQTLATSKRGNIFHVRSVQQSAISAKLIEMGLYVGQEVEILLSEHPQFQNNINIYEI